MWRIGQLVLESLFRETDEVPLLWTKDSNLQMQLVETYRASIQRGLTPRDALAVATALATVNKGSLLAPDLAKRARRVSH